MKMKILEMSKTELECVIAIVQPGKSAKQLRIDEMQEMAIKWLFANGLSINHQFEIRKNEEDFSPEYYCIIRSGSCDCCEKESQTASMSSFDKGPIGDNFPRAKSPNPQSRKPPAVIPTTNKITPITVQPTVIKVESPEAAKKEKEEAEGKSSCRRECGLCFVQLCSQF
ncbi:unnamed protein product [Caenorhabditis angaria]|uniref:Uncharacterized protein n=1 Tax=Caenorhabditis angaria TaxID=860376 RepID=A0A9P1N309_9PELO|nr:unnamed protein product [Caenorhabditis angaria]